MFSHLIWPNYFSRQIFKLGSSGSKRVNVDDINNNSLVLKSYLQMAGEANGNDQLCTDCIFCDIIRKNDPEAIVYKDDQVLVLTDIKPAAKHHYLVVSNQHISTPKSLDESHACLVEHMVAVGKKVLEDNNGDTTSIRSGFHWPPFHSVAHLHLHVISPISEMGFASRCIFRPSNLWFVTPEYVLTNLKPKVKDDLGNGKL